MATRLSVLIERFYLELWNQADEAVAHEILSPRVRFRGSLGPESVGVERFIGYLRLIHSALANYKCEIEEIVEQGSSAATRMRFSGVHQGLLFGMPATNREIAWSGAAFFGLAAGRITTVWALGDVDAVKQQLGLTPQIASAP